MKTLAMYLLEKGITMEQFEAKTAEEQLKLLKAHNSEVTTHIKGIQDDVDSKISKTDVAKMLKDAEVNHARELKAMNEVNTENGRAIKEMLKIISGGGNTEAMKSERGQINKWIKDSATKIEDLYAKKTGFIEFTAKDMTTGSATVPNGIPDLVATQNNPASNVNLRTSIVDTLVSSFETSQSAYGYTESLPANGDFDFVAEKATKPEIDFTIESEYAKPKKIAAHIILTDESVKDIKGLQSLATKFLRDKHDLRRQKGILFGDGVGENPLGATVLASAFNSTGMLNKVASPNFMDVVNAMITDIYTNPNYVDEMPYMANIVLVNPIDFFLELVSAKDGEGRSLYPSAGLFNRVIIGGTLIVPLLDIPAGKIFTADMKKYFVSNYVPYSVRIGWINDQLIKNQFTMVGESRFHAFVKVLDKVAFRYDDIATIRVAIAEL